MGRKMRWAVVSGDGLPVSGLLTIFRNVVDRAREADLLEFPVTADLGYSWRADKQRFFPRGLPGAEYPSWLQVSDAVPVPVDPARWMEKLDTIRRTVAAAEELDEAEAAELRREIETHSEHYEKYFYDWFTEHDVDWVIAINLTLSDAVPVTTALHRAAARRWAGDRPGGVLYWDHDLFGSCAIFEDGKRFYPAAPNDVTPVPGTTESDRWAVVSPALLTEARKYPSELEPELLTNVLPLVPGGPLESRHHEFLAERDIEPDRPVVLVPVRVFAVKGVDISVRVFAGARDECARLGVPDPVLLVFGSLDEEPGYADVVREAVAETDAADAVRFLDGVPISSHRDSAGAWQLDEIDLVRVARASHGAVLFTPSCVDVETVGLGPALAALAGIPCAVTPYDAFADHFGPGFSRVEVDPEDPRPAGHDLARRLSALREGDAALAEAMRANLARVEERFPDGPWTTFLAAMADGTA
ncbi:hypothetical protein [Amycolatopsis sp. WQ 127309]|uniref:hypothetical protein n=1 Tax=Amycolatopsis sp. WQ 127309 TaxID=2932773 RepID=UPI001FF6789D|nr:hypothetical protein [Amycolatopsis sp. WQ 127309]UOZ03604.1 hypothetical protein MUY22_32725 [Amycolatopsis sp. WQ 127309]